MEKIGQLTTLAEGEQLKEQHCEGGKMECTPLILKERLK
jgi:hypothetical protein